MSNYSKCWIIKPKTLNELSVGHRSSSLEPRLTSYKLRPQRLKKDQMSSTFIKNKIGGSKSDRQNATAKFIRQNGEPSRASGGRELEVSTATEVFQQKSDDVSRQDGGSGQDNGRADTRGVQDRARSVADRGRSFGESVYKSYRLTFRELVFILRTTLQLEILGSCA